MAIARIYLRNSSDKQAKAATIRAQRPDCHALAGNVAASCPVAEYADEGVSGDAPLAERRALHRLLADVEMGDVVIAFAQDRLSRSDDMIEHAEVFGVLQRRGVVVHTVQEGALDMRDQIGRLRAQLQSDASASEKRKILARTAAGKRSAAIEGRKPQGATPYGLAYDRTAKKWSEHPAHAAVERDIFARLLAGETTGKIATRLRAAKAPHPRGPAWSAARVWRIATRTAARGEWEFDGRAIAVPAVIDAATWHAVQAQLMASGRRGLRRTQHVYLLDDGTGRCGHCGGQLFVKWGGRANPAPYYLCPRRDCMGGWRRVDQVDAEVFARMVAALQRPDLAERAMGQQVQQGDADLADQHAAKFEAKIAKLDGIEAALLARFRRGTISEAGMDRESTAIAKERAMLAASASAARAEALQARRANVGAAGAREAMRVIAGEMEQSGPAERREIVRTLQPRVEVARDEIRIRFNVRVPALVALVPPIAMAHSTCSCTQNHCATEATDGGAVEIAIVA